MKELNDILLDYDEFLKFHPDFDINQLFDNRYCYALSIDLAEGNGGDYDIINIFQILPMSLFEISQLKVYSDEYSFFKLVQIGIFRCNSISIPDFAKYSYHFLTELFVQDNVKITLENNYEGNYYRTTMTSIYGENNEIDEDYSFVRYPYNMRDDQAQATRIGIFQNEQTKEYGCKLAKDQIRNNQIILTESVTIAEALSFAKNPKKKGKGSYEAMLGNDDAIMSTINIANFRFTEDFQELVDIVSPYCSRDFWKAVNEKLNKKDADDGSGGDSDISDIFG